MKDEWSWEDTVITMMAMDKRYRPVFCSDCGRYIAPDGYAWHINGKTLCCSCASLNFRSTVEEPFVCDRCGRKRPTGSYRWYIPEMGYQLCSVCASRMYYEPIWHKWLTET